MNKGIVANLIAVLTVVLLCGAGAQTRPFESKSPNRGQASQPTHESRRCPVLGRG